MTSQTQRSRRPRRALALTGVAATALALAACSPGASDGGGTGDSDATTVTFRLWDEAAAAAYEDSFAAFTEQNPEIVVDIEIVPWANYWDQLPLDIQSGSMADIFWSNSSNYGVYADQGSLLDITEELGDDHDEWTEGVVELYTRDGALWGVPQLSDSIALFYNIGLLEEAGIDPETLFWSPDPSQDTLIEAAQTLTVDSAGNDAASEEFDPDSTQVYAFNAQYDLQAIWLGFLNQNGAVFQDEDDQYAFDSPQGVEAFQYLTDLINTYRVAPPASETNANGDLSRDLFVQGRLALFQSGQYALPHVSAIEDFEWGIAPLIEGPEGRVSVVHGVSALGNAATDHPEEVVEVLRWLGSAQGQGYLGSTGSLFPAAVDAQPAFTEYWDGQGVDTTQFIEAANGATAEAPRGPLSNAGLNALQPHLQDALAGLTPVPEAVAAAQADANEAIAD